MQHAIDDGLKLCGSCGLAKPVEDYRYRSRKNDTRHTQCNDCWAAYQRDYRDGQKKQELAGYVTQVAAAAGPPETSAVSRTEAVINAMLVRFGGVDRLTGEWLEVLERAKASGKIHIVQRTLEVMSRMMEFADRQTAERAATAEDVEAMSTDELRVHLAAVVEQQIVEQPDFAAGVLEQLGWELRPPSESPEPSESALVTALTSCSGGN